MSRPVPYAAHHAQLPGMFMGRMGAPIRPKRRGVGDAAAAQVVSAAQPGIVATGAAIGAGGGGLLGGIIGLIAGHPGAGALIGLAGGGVAGFFVGSSMAQAAGTVAAQAPPTPTPSPTPSPTGAGAVSEGIKCPGCRPTAPLATASLPSHWGSR